MLVVGMLGLGIQQAKAGTIYTDPNKITVSFAEGTLVNAVEIQCEPNDVNTNFSVSYGTAGIWKVGPIVTHEPSPGVIKYYIKYTRSSGISSDTLTTRIKSPSDANMRGTRGRFSTIASSDGTIVSDNSGATYLKRRRTDVPALFKLDFNKATDNNDTNSQAGFTRFTEADSEMEDVNGQTGVVVDLGGDIASLCRSEPNNKNDPCDPTFDPSHTPIYFTKLYRDFICGVGTPPGGVKMTIWGLGAGRDCNVVIYSFDTEAAIRRADWKANGQYILTTDFVGSTYYIWYGIDPCNWPRTEDAYAWPGTAKADDLGRITLTSSKDPCSSANDSFAYVNGLMVYTTGTYVEPKYAQVPRPPEGQKSVPIDTLLKWRKGAGVVKHDLYFGDNFNDVNAAARDTHPGVLIYSPNLDADANTFDPGMLDLSKTYYWRVDENDTSTLWKGEVWSFTTYTPVLTAGNLVPPDGATKVPAEVILKWTAGEYAETHDVYLGTDLAKVTDANRNNPMGVLVSKGQSDTTYDPTPGYLDSNTTYYWRIDEVNAAPDYTIFKGGIWSFTTYEPTTTWRVDARCFENGPPGSFDNVSVKDPSIVYAGGKWRLFYTFCGLGGQYAMGYASATTIAGLRTATHYNISNHVHGCAPNVFFFEPQGKWYLIHYTSFSTSTDINDPNGWTDSQSMGISDGIDHSMISDGNNMYVFYAPDDGRILRRSTTVADFPYNWSASTVVATDTFEGPCVYKNRADGKYYMLTESLGSGGGRYYELWTADNPGGTWTKVEEQWAHKDKLVYFADHWTDQVSHGELIRAGTNEKMEISDINRCQFLIQGVPSGFPGDYGSIPYNLGIIGQCIGTMGDLDYDYDIDLVDYAIFASQWLKPQPPGIPSADIGQPGGDGIVDMQDLARLVDNWLWDDGIICAK